MTLLQQFNGKNLASCEAQLNREILGDERFENKVPVIRERVGETIRYYIVQTDEEALRKYNAYMMKSFRGSNHYFRIGAIYKRMNKRIPQDFCRWLKENTHHAREFDETSNKFIESMPEVSEDILGLKQGFDSDIFAHTFAVYSKKLIPSTYHIDRSLMIGDGQKTFYFGVMRPMQVYKKDMSNQIVLSNNRVVAIPKGVFIADKIGTGKAGCIDDISRKYDDIKHGIPSLFQLASIGDVGMQYLEKRISGITSSEQFNRKLNSEDRVVKKLTLCKSIIN